MTLDFDAAPILGLWLLWPAAVVLAIIIGRLGDDPPDV